MKLKYKEWLKTQEKYSGKNKCFVADCDKPGLYEMGDARYWCGGCEEHAGMQMKYQDYLQSNTREPEVRGTW